MTDKLCYYLNVCPKGTNVTAVNTLLLEEQREREREREREQCGKNEKEKFGGEISRFRKKTSYLRCFAPNIIKHFLNVLDFYIGNVA